MTRAAELMAFRAESILTAGPGLLTLPATFDPVRIAGCLREALPNEYGTIQAQRFQILKYHPGSRCTFEIAMDGTKGCRCVIGKVYATDRWDVYRAMREIQGVGFGPQDEFSIPEPLAYLADLRLLLQEKVEGPRVKEILLNGTERDRGEACVRCARWLAKFHVVGPRSGGVQNVAEELNSIARWSRAVAKLGQPLEAMAERLCRRLEETAHQVLPRAISAGHGSFSCNQIIAGEKRTVAFDWDSYGIADPCRDAARFLVALQRLAFKYLGSMRALDTVAEVFLKTYQSASPFDVTANLPWYRALTCLRLSKYEAHRPVCTFRDGIAALLSEGLRNL